MFFYGIPLWTENIIINSVLVLNVGSVEKNNIIINSVLVLKMHLCALKFVVQCNKVGSVEKIIRWERGSVLCTRLIYTQKWWYVRIMSFPGSLIIACQGSIASRPLHHFLTLPSLLHRCSSMAFNIILFVQQNGSSHI